jgi:Holliday junction resolvase RusA-like endonuclease
LACRQRPHHREQEIYREWVANAGAELLVQRPKKHTGPVAISIELGLPDKRRRDIDNCCNRCSIYWRGTPS